MFPAVVTWCLRTYIGLRSYMVNVYIKERINDQKTICAGGVTSNTTYLGAKVHLHLQFFTLRKEGNLKKVRLAVNIGIFSSSLVLVTSHLESSPRRAGRASRRLTFSFSFCNPYQTGATRGFGRD